jgi:O-antigen ligase/polysaccharide polymerase Wzy-like membrane protein
MDAGRTDVSLIVGVCALGLFVAWGALDGGSEPTTWYAGGLFLVALLSVTAFGRRLRLPRSSVWPLALFALFTAWCFLSITWADVRGDAWDGANRTLLYLIVYALFACTQWRPASAALVFGLFALGIAGLGTVVFIRASFGDPASAFLGKRFFEPMGYENANVAFFLLAFWPALFLASRREVPVAIRALLLGGAGVLVELALLGQSRGALFAFPVVLALYFVIVPGRVRSLVALLPIGAVVAVASGPLLDVYARFDEDAKRNVAVDGARDAILASFAVLVLAGLLIAHVDRRLDVPESRARNLRKRTGAVAIAAIVAASVGLLVSIGNPVTRAASAWDEFRAGPQVLPADSSRFSNLGSNRYDIWRVALNEFVSSPVHGVGVDNFATDQIRERRTLEEPRYPHSVELRVLAQTGIIGTVLFAGFVVAALKAVWRARSRQGPFARALAGTLVVTFAYWLAHGSVDWFWEFPALAAPAFACLATASRLGAPPGDGLDRAQARFARLLLATLVATIAVTLASFVPPWLAARYVKAATHGWRADPSASYVALGRARRLNFLSDRPDVFMAAIAARRHEWARARAAFERALERNPNNWYARLELGVLDAMTNRRESALGQLREADRLNPREPVIDLAVERVTTGKRITVQELERVFRQRVENRFGLAL